ncbi:MAG: FAD-dependent oxidoreductase [Planctomycetes bacterium]|nr:FAD-dependent oxidoreductase [Planctomycetota bacterium]
MTGACPRPVRALEPSARADVEVDIVVYGGTSGGIAAAIQARRMGKSCLLIEPGHHLGGLTSGGLGATDIGNKKAIGGIAREFYRRVKRYYDNPAAWKQQPREAYRSPRQSTDEDTMWTFEPHVAESIYREMLRECDATVLEGEWLDETDPLVMRGGRIERIRLASGMVVSGELFIDATYEGDLMAAAGVRFHVGREANSAHNETLNGVQTRNAVHHQFVPGVDPYVRRGDPSSGLLPGVHAGPAGDEGSGDSRVQAYNFRMCLTDDPANILPIQKPEAYDPLRYELVLRNFEAGETRAPWSLILMPNRKTDINNNHGFSTDHIGMSYAWPSASRAERERIFRDHLDYQQGLIWTLAHDPRVPESIRSEVARWGLCRDEFADHGGWPHQIYVREARRMIADCVMTQHHCQGREVVDDPVGLAAYTMDSHNVQRYVDAKGHVRNEGDVQVGGFPPYPIAYRSIRPRKEECRNLLVPVALSASHIAYGSIRMEPVFMVLGQSAATAACLALDARSDIQDVEFAALRARLESDGQILAWTGPVPTRASIDIQKLPGIVIDDGDAERSPGWSPSRSVGGYVGERYWHDGNERQGERKATYRAKLEPGRYEVRFSFTSNPNRATNVRITIRHADGSAEKTCDQRAPRPADDPFVSLGVYPFGASPAEVEVSNAGANGHVVIDAVQFLKQ